MLSTQTDTAVSTQNGVMNTDRYSSEHTEGTLVEPGGVLGDGHLAGSSGEAMKGQCLCLFPGDHPCV